MAHSDCGWTCGCAGKTVKSLENTCAPERFCGGDSLQRGAISSVCTFTGQPTHLHSLVTCVHCCISTFQAVLSIPLTTSSSPVSTTFGGNRIVPNVIKDLLDLQLPATKNLSTYRFPIFEIFKRHLKTHPFTKFTHICQFCTSSDFRQCKFADDMCLTNVCIIVMRISSNWRAPWKNQTSRYISFFCPSLNGVLFPMFCLLVKGSVRF